MRTLFCLIAFCAVLRAQEGGVEPRKPAGPTAAEKNKLAELLPAPPGFGCDPKSPAKFYSADLASYLGLKADAYFDYGLVALAHREFKCLDVDLTVDIYDMGDSLRAFGIYSVERSPADMFIPMGAEGYVDVGLLNFLQGAYYVKLRASGSMDRSPTALELSARNIAGRIGLDSKVPQPVGWFPAEGQVAGSVKYIIKAPMGFELLAPATTVLYGSAEKPTTVLAYRAATAEDAVNRLGKLNEQMAGHGPMANVPGLPGAKQQGEVISFSRGCYVVVVRNPPPDRDAFLRAIYSAVKD
ncbi:MAG TPA: DUF6599 family protein [Verrucomicrobiae bacterium]|nr:DUF6599 family protein [Verrucomicrobiae bacterium]